MGLVVCADGLRRTVRASTHAFIRFYSKGLVPEVCFPVVLRALGEGHCANRSAMPNILSSNNYKWYAVAMLWWIAFFNYADRQSVFSLFPLLVARIQSERRCNSALLGSSFAAVYGISAPVVGFVVDRVPAQGLHSRRTSRLERHLHGHGGFAQLCATALFSRRRGPGRDHLLSRVDVVHRRLPRQDHSLARHGHAPDQRLHRHYRGRILRRAHRPALWLAVVVRRLRRGGNRARLYSQQPARRARSRSRRPGRREEPPTKRQDRAPGVSVAEFFRLIFARPSLALCMGAFCARTSPPWSCSPGCRHCSTANSI